MKILHISTLTFGGAGTAALRLHKGLLSEGIESNLLALRNNTQLVPNIYLFQPAKKNYTLYEKVLKRLNPITNEQKNAKMVMDMRGNYDIYTFPTTDYALHEHPLVRQADIINLHWVANFLDYPSFFTNIKKPIVWTLHDMNPFQGGFHYKDDEIRNQSVFGKLDQNIKEQKKRCYQNSSITEIIAPSKWLMQESSRSNLLGNFRHKHIPYGLDTDIFYPYEKSFARQVFQLPKDHKVLLFVSDDVSNYRKGFDLLLGSLEELTSTEKYTIVAIGNIPEKKVDGITYIGSIKDERLMSLAYSAADVFILPSREDNLPNVILESLACGTPVIATPIGGMLDIIKNGFNGFLAKDVSVEALKTTIKRYFANPGIFKKQDIRQDAVKEFDLSVQAKRYLELYKEVLHF